MMTQREEIAVGQLEIGFLLAGDGCDGSLSMFEFVVPAEARVPAAHSHDGYEETIYGLEGVLTWTVDGREVEVGPGDVLFIRRGLAHKFENRGDAEANARSRDTGDHRAGVLPRAP